MRLVSFSVENYRSITKARRIPLTASTVLIGPNNEGKSNILRALSVAMRALARYQMDVVRSPRGRVRPGAPVEDYYDWERDFPLSARKANGAGTTKITLDFSLSEDEINEFRDEIKSNLNGTLPVCISFKPGGVEVKIVKQGPGSSTLNAKSARITRFLATRIQFQYIPAVRTARSATSVVEDIVASELRELESDQVFQKALEDIRQLQRPILEHLSKRVTGTLKQFVPGIKAVSFTVSDEDRYSALRRSVAITIDDGVVTSLESKGDGIQSLVALGVRQHALEEQRAKRSYIFAIEEPEAHLHPNAVHELRGVLDALSKTDQIVVTTHSPLFVNRQNIESNVIVNKAVAAPASSLTKIRQILGVRSYDNLVNADVVLIVEGEDDRRAIQPILESRSAPITAALKAGRLIIDPLEGAGKLGSKVALYRGILCKVHCFLDYDAAGQLAINAAKTAHLLEDKDYQCAMLVGLNETEFEDLLDPAIYVNAIRDHYGIDVTAFRSRNKKEKWSNRLRDIFAQAGKPFDDKIEAVAKLLVANAVAENPRRAIAPHADGIVATLITQLEDKLQA